MKQCCHTAGEKTVGNRSCKTSQYTLGTGLSAPTRIERCPLDKKMNSGKAAYSDNIVN